MPSPAIDRSPGLSDPAVHASWLGFVPDEVTAAPGAVVNRLAERLYVDPAALAGYGWRGQSRTDHPQSVPDCLGWHQAPPCRVRCQEVRQSWLTGPVVRDVTDSCRMRRCNGPLGEERFVERPAR